MVTVLLYLAIVTGDLGYVEDAVRHAVSCDACLPELMVFIFGF